MTRLCIETERAIVLALRGDCHSPIAARASISGQSLSLQARVGWRDGNPPVISATATGLKTDPSQVIQRVLEQLAGNGAEKMLAPS